MNNNDFAVIILAGGKSTRMISDLPKALVQLKNKPMVSYVLEASDKAFKIKPIMVIGHKKEQVQEFIGDGAIFAVQEEQLGTGHAVLCAETFCGNKKHIIILQCDQPLIKEKTLNNLLTKHIESGAKITFTTTIVPDFLDWRQTFKKFGRILRDNGNIIGIKEYKDANEEEKNILEVNAGTYIFEAPWVWKNLKKINNKNTQGEYYLTDLFHMAREEKEKIESIQIDGTEALSANSLEELEILETFDITP